MGSMTVEEIYRDRKKFSKAVFEVASSDLVNMGITVVSYTLKDIRDEEGYLKALGLARTAEVKRDARIGEAEARRDAQIKEAIAEEERMASRLLNDTEIAKAKRDFELKKAAYDVEVQTKVCAPIWLLSSYLQVTTDISPQKAEAELAYELQAAKTKQRIKEENMQIKVTSTCTCTLCSSVCDPSGDREEPGDRDPGAGDRQEGEGAGELHQEASGGGEVQAGEDGGGTQVNTRY